MGLTALVIGATGVVGRELVDQLSQLADIDKVTAVTRRPIEYGSDKIINCVVEFDRLEQYSSAFKVDITFSCLGTTLKQAGSIERQRQVDVDYQYRAAKLARTNGVNHYLLVSSSGANPTSKSNYLKMKGELEAKVAELGFTRASIIQPSLLLGERQDFRLGERLGSKLLPLICRLPVLSKYRPITGKQVAAKMCLIALQQVASADNDDDPKLRYYRLDELFS
ncbi:oxidoreductase [Shewanella eurypsychrophilus]|uniref:Oxidoreductase n=1 Tax=Shewanella eurypsychrophilus TaxID=2593656 RepID=A0ABX6VHV0_9GAMM|nr:MULTISPECIES: oxidoreductase [Shewanella]QFU24551.1 NAD(P)H-binding protein [Shewanella sp. YLB-09]QPG59747.1 oxidoreductase [Shewanella eurypsychrophilus]